MNLKDCIKQVSKEQGIPEDVCYRAYMSAWKFILETAKSQNLSPEVSLEEFRKSRPNFNIRGIGKLYVSEDAFIRKNKRILTLRKLKEEKDDKGNQDD
jgi:hypothetical protein